MTAASQPRGRYVLNQEHARAVGEGQKASHDVVIHDSEHFHEECNTDDMKHKSYFNDLDWALMKGYRPCQHCMPTPTIQTVHDGGNA